MVLELKEAREKAGLTLDDVAAELKIRKKYIIALEEGDNESLPGKVYIQGYTSMYHKFLGIEYPLKDITSKKKKKKLKKPIKNKRKKILTAFIASLLLLLVVFIYVLNQDL